MRDVDTFRRELAGHALRQPAQRELAHGERSRLRIALHARRGAGEQDRAVRARQHAPHRLLGDREAAERGNGHRLFHLRGIEIDDRGADAMARVVDHGLGRTDRCAHVGEQLHYLIAVGCIARKQLGAGFRRQRRKILDAARRKRHRHIRIREHARDRGTQPRTRAHDQCRTID